MDLDRSSQPMGSRPALVVVDVINGFTDPSCPLGSEADSVVAANRRLLAAFRERELPIFFTTVTYHNDQQASVFRARVNALNCLKANSHWVEIDPRLGRLENEEIIEKRWASGFFGTDLSNRLQQVNANCLLVTGLTTSGCVRATVVDGLQHNYPVFVAEEAVGDRNPDAHAANLFDMHAKYADVALLEDLIEQLL